MEKKESFNEQIDNLKKEIGELPEDQQDLAEEILTSYAEKVNRTNDISKEIDKYMEDNPEFNPIYMTRRPEGLSYEAYRVLGRAAKKSIKQYLRRV